jgi:hypothetical protein
MQSVSKSPTEWAFCADTKGISNHPFSSHRHGGRTRAFKALRMATDQKAQKTNIPEPERPDSSDKQEQIEKRPLPISWSQEEGLKLFDIEATPEVMINLSSLVKTFFLGASVMRLLETLGFLCRVLAGTCRTGMIHTLN